MVAKVVRLVGFAFLAIAALALIGVQTGGLVSGALALGLIYACQPRRIRRR